jgi:hypothetical protein
MPLEFEAKILREAGSDALFLRLPVDASEQLPTRSMCSVEGEFGGVSFWVTLQPDGLGGHWMPISSGVAASAGLGKSDLVRVSVAPMKEEPEPVVPSDFATALAGSPEASRVWEKTTALARRDWLFWMSTGKKAETRGIRIEKAIDMLAHGKKRICCFDRSGMYSKSFSGPVAED